MMIDSKWFIAFLALLLTTGNINAQSAPKPNQTDQKRFEGLWTNKKTSRCLEIYFEYGYATIMDWTPKFQKRESADVYKALPKNGKLVMPEETEHHAPYSEIVIAHKRLIYLTKQMGTGKKPAFDKIVFTRPISK